MRLYSIIILMIIANSNYCYPIQNNNNIDSLKLVETQILLNNAFKHGLKKVDDSTLFYFNKAKNIYKKYNEWELYVKINVGLAYLYERHNQKDKAQKIYVETLDLGKKKLDKKNPFLIELYIFLANSYYSKGDLYNSIEQLKSASKLYASFGDIEVFSRVFSLLSYRYYKILDFKKSYEFIEKSIRIKSIIGLNNKKLTDSYILKGDILKEMGELKKAENAYHSAIKIYKKLEDKYALISCYYKIASISELTKNLDKALSVYNYILDETNKNKFLGGENRRYIYLYVYEKIGLILQEKGEYKKAHQFFKKALSKSKNKQIDTSNLYLGNSFQIFGQYDSALYNYQQGLMSIINTNFSFWEENVYVNPSLDYINSIREKKTVFLLLQGKAKAFFNKYKLNNKLNDLEKAFQTYNLIVNLYDKIPKGNNSISKDGIQIKWVEFMLPIYSEAIQTCFVYYKQSKEEKYKIRAFEIIEKSKSATLLSGLLSSNARYFSGISDSLLVKEHKNKINFNYYEGLLQKELVKKNGYDTVKVNKIKEKLFTINRDREGLEEVFVKKFPKYFELKYNINPISISDVQGALDDKTSLIEYFVSDSSIFAFTISKNSSNLKRLNFIDDLEKKVKRLSHFLLEKEKEAFSKVSLEFYNKLFKPLEIKTPNLIIVPGGALWHLNFDLLIQENPTKLDYRKFAYLLRDYTISYNYSAKLFSQELAYKISPSKNECLAFSYNNPDDITVGNYIAMRGFRDKKLGDLPGTRKEIKAVSSVMDGAYYFGSFANEKNFKKNAKDFNILHLALHGVIDHKKPMNSKLYFTQDMDSIEDNFLHAYELYNLELNAELAVLSACNTGSGKLIKGEGVMSLGRAFTYAGCKSLLLSQWDVSDAFTPSIMKSFYQNLKDGKTKAAALREAKLTYLAKSDNLTSNPYYWAPLIQLGDNRPLKQDDYLIWIVSIAAIIVFIGVLFYIKLRN